METIEKMLLNNTNFLDALILCLGIWLIIAWRLKRDFKRYFPVENPDDVIKVDKIWLKKHPLSAISDVLRMSILYCELPDANLSKIKRLSRQIWVADVCDVDPEVCIMLVVMLREYGYTEVYDILRKKMARCKHPKLTEYMLLLSEDGATEFCLQMVQREEKAPKRISYYLLGKTALINQDPEQAKAYFQQAIGEQQDPVMIELLKRRGYAHEEG